MKKINKILFLIIIVSSLGGFTKAVAQNLPSACVGTTEVYGVKGFNGISDFDWVITDPQGNILPATSYQLLARGDSIKITWGEGLLGGIYTLTVTEHTDYGCTGVPYSTNIVLNTPEIFLPISNVMADTRGICYGSIATLDPGSGFINYLWQDGNTNRIYYTGDAGTYIVRLINSTYNCSYDSTRLAVWDLPTVSLGNDTVLTASQSLELDVYNPDFTFYNWNTGAISPSITVNGQDGNQQVWVIVTDLNGCVNSDTINIKAADFKKLFIPAAFTPNGDGFNDLWEFPASKDDLGNNINVSEFIEKVDVQVFNRWGKLVWKSNGLYKPWNGKDIAGKDLPMDSYHYVIVFNVQNKNYEYKGSVTIIR